MHAGPSGNKISDHMKAQFKTEAQRQFEAQQDREKMKVEPGAWKKQRDEKLVRELRNEHPPELPKISEGNLNISQRDLAELELLYLGANTDKGTSTP